jgi:hypothetical protein
MLTKRAGGQQTTNEQARTQQRTSMNVNSSLKINATTKQITANIHPLKLSDF